MRMMWTSAGRRSRSIWDAVGISTFSQASRMLLLGLNRGIAGNAFIEFQTSVKALGLMPGDLITVTYLKENLERTPFRITKITPGNSFRTATITAQFHDDAWYSDTATGITGGLGRQTGQGSGLPAPVIGTVLDANGNLQLGITEAEVTGERRFGRRRAERFVYRAIRADRNSGGALDRACAGGEHDWRNAGGRRQLLLCRERCGQRRRRKLALIHRAGHHAGWSQYEFRGARWYSAAGRRSELSTFTAALTPAVAVPHRVQPDLRACFHRYGAACR